jgi:hypothetical protein
MPNAFDDLPPTSPEIQAMQQATPEGRPNAFADLATPEWKSGRVKEGNPYAIPKNSPLYGEGEGQMALEGVGRGMTNVVRHAGNLVGLESDQDLASANQLDQPLMNQPAGRFGNVVGEAATLTPAAMGAGAGLGAMGVGPVAGGALEGAGQGALMADPGQKGTGAAIGAITGGAVPFASTAVQKLAYGLTRTPEAQQLIDQGVRLTPGQMNPHGVWNKIEENVRGVPMVGNVVEKARTQAQQDFQRGVIGESAAPGYSMQGTSKDPNELFQEAQDSYAPLYKAAQGFPVSDHIPYGNGPPTPLATALQQASQAKTVGATRATREQASDFLTGQLEAIKDKASATGGLQSDDLIKLRSNISEEMRGAGIDNAGKSYAKLLGGARDQVTNSINSQIPPDAAAALKTANDAYPKLAIIRDAIKRGGDQEQGFTPAQLSQSVKQAAENNEYARGGGLMRDWSSAGRDIFTEQNPKTGASHGTTGTLLGGAYALHHYIPGAQVPAALGSLGALGMIGTQTGREILGGSTAPQQAAQRLGDALKNATTPGQREIAGAVSRSALNRAAALRALNPAHNQQQDNEGQR